MDIGWLISLTEARPRWWLEGLREHHPDPRVRQLAARLLGPTVEAEVLAACLLELLTSESVGVSAVGAGAVIELASRPRDGEVEVRRPTGTADR